jgi:hypothetical protein
MHHDIGGNQRQNSRRHVEHGLARRWAAGWLTVSKCHGGTYGRSAARRKGEKTHLGARNWGVKRVETPEILPYLKPD